MFDLCTITYYEQQKFGFSCIFVYLILVYLPYYASCFAVLFY